MGPMRSYQPVWTDRLIRAAGVIGDVPSMFTPQLQPGITLEDLTDQQYLWLSRTGSLQVAGTTPTNAGRGSCLLLTASSPDIERIVRVRKIYLQATAAVFVRWQILPPGVLPAIQDLAVGGILPRDSRMLITGGVPTNLVANYGTSVATAAGQQAFLPAGGPTQVFDVALTFRPDSGLFIGASANNLAFVCGVDWEERDVTKQEKI